MNTDAQYEDHRPRPKEQDPPSPPTELELSTVARYDDPPLTHSADPTSRSAGGWSIVWARPSELATTVASPMLRRGAEVQANLARQARRAPAPAARTGRRVTSSAIAWPQQAGPTQEGLGL